MLLNKKHVDLQLKYKVLNNDIQNINMNLLEIFRLVGTLRNV